MKHIHEELLEPYNQTGQLLSKINSSRVFVLNSKGYLVPCRLSVRIDNLICGSVNYVAFINFDKNNSGFKNCIISNRVGEILEISESLSTYFSQKHNLFKYNEDLKTVFESLNNVCRSKINHLEKGENYNILTKDKVMMESWSEKYRREL